jgi:RNA-directed DNA polymerase
MDMGFLRRLFGGNGGGRKDGSPPGLGVDELARRLGLTVEQLRAVKPSYREFAVPKRSGGKRRILAPEPELKALQRRILHRLLRRLKAHPVATGFERGHSIVTNALCHVGKAVVVRMDLKDFFTSTSAKRVRRYFESIGWDGEASKLLTALVTHDGGLPQGAPTSPRLANLVNGRLDARLEGLARKLGAAYTRYADDLTFSFARDDREAVHAIIGSTKRIVDEEGYTLHQRKKLHIRRRGDRQVVTGIVVNRKAALPRATRRWLRAVEHRAATGGNATLTPAQLAGWRAFAAMVKTQATDSGS